jgi:hypothetical protein
LASFAVKGLVVAVAVLRPGRGASRPGRLRFLIAHFVGTRLGMTAGH